MATSCTPGKGGSQASSRSFPELELELHSLPGKGNRELYGGLIDIIDRAEHSIHMVGPYVSPPFTGHLAAAADRGVEVHFVTPRDNNKAYLQKHLLAEAARSPVHLWLYGGGMIHMKCMLIDDRALITGSSNFDLMSYHGFLAEVVAVFRSAAVISSFRRQVLEPDLAASQRLSVTGRHSIGAWGRTIARAKIRAATLVARTLSPATTREPHGR